MARLHLDRSRCRPDSTARTVSVDVPWTGFPCRVTAESGRVPGESRRFQRIAIDGGTHQMTPEQARELAVALLLAADWCDGKAECEEVSVAERRRQEDAANYEAAKAERDRRLAEEGVAVRCSGCGKTAVRLPEQVPDWLKSTPSCCRKRNRRYEVAP